MRFLVVDVDMLHRPANWGNHSLQGNWLGMSKVSAPNERLDVMVYKTVARKG
jgi:hypothetical protein